MDNTLDVLLKTASKWDRDNLIKAYKVYPRPQLRPGDVFTTNCESSVSHGYPSGIDYQMRPGDKVLVLACLPITRFDGSLVSREDGPHWCYTFRNLLTGVEFEMQGHPALIDIMPRTEASEALYE